MDSFLALFEGFDLEWFATNWQDCMALLLFVGSWVAYAHYSDHQSQGNLLATTNLYRKRWMREMMKRDNRTVDAITVGNLSRAITFFANTTIFILLGLMSMLGYRDKLGVIMGTIPFAQHYTSFMWEIKTFLLIIIFIYAFFKYTWSLRQYNYANIFIVSAPTHKERVEEHEAIAQKGALLVSNAARHFNNGLRAYYFGLAALAWFIHPLLFTVATAWVVFVTHRREFRSVTLSTLAD